MLILNFLCVIFLVVAVWFGVHQYTFLKDSIPIQGKIVDVARSFDEESNSSFPIIEYINPLTQQKKQFKASAAALNVTIGKKVWVAYRENQQTEKLISFGELLLFPVALGSVGVTFLLIILPLSESSHILYWLLKMLHLFKQ